MLRLYAFVGGVEGPKLGGQALALVHKKQVSIHLGIRGYCVSNTCALLAEGVLVNRDDFLVRQNFHDI